MKGFRYKHGDRPLEGYTIQRAAGKGGFGEVYYAVSDSGREVALKVIYGYEQIELRGVSQCMNLKSPHLVSIFDVRHNDEGLPFVIMEYVAGPSLRGLLDESPGGLGSQKSAFFLREIGKGLSYLHECGIVHRDLKPGNIFYENGYVKIGDYGLSKAMSASQHSGQTITVGTVHYMAPEIGAGKYDKSIDIYALGACLYEMLTGTVPYLGGSPGEILMKHLSAEPDVSKIEEPFATVIRKAMAKNPADRYQSVQEMIEAVFGAEHVRESVSCFAPESLSMIAQRVAARVAVGVGAGSKTPPPIPDAMLRDRGADVWEQMGNWVDRAGDRVAELGGRVINNQWWPPSQRMAEEARPAETTPRGGGRDPLMGPQRRVLALIVLGVLTVAVAALSAPAAPESTWFSVLVTTAAMSGGALLARHKLLPQLAREGLFVQRLAIGGMAAVAMLLIGGMTMPFTDGGRAADRLVYSGFAALVPLFLLDWVKAMAPDRAQRVILGHAAGVGAIAFVAAMIFEGFPAVAIGLAAGTSLLVQVLSPWHSTARDGRGFEPVMRQVPAHTPADIAPDAPTRPMRAWWQKRTHGQPPHDTDQPAQTPARATPIAAASIRKVPHYARYIWLALTTLALPLGIMLIVFPNFETYIRDDEFGMFVAFGVGQLLFAVVTFIKSFHRRFHGWWRYLFKPMLLWACAQTILIASIMMGMSNLRGDEAMIATFFIVFPAVAGLLILFAGFFQADDGPVAPGTPQFSSQLATENPQAQFIESPGGAMNAGSDAVTTAMPPAAFASPSRPSQDLPPQGSVIHLGAAVIGWLLLIGGMILGILTAIDLPGMIFIQRPDVRWGNGPSPGLIRLMMGVGTFVLMLVSSGFLMGARRPQGALHGLRALGAVVAAGLCLCFIYAAFSDRGGLRASRDRAAGVDFSMTLPPGMNEKRPLLPPAPPGRVIEQYINDIEIGFLIPAGIFAVASAALLSWPARRSRPMVLNR